MAAAFQQRKPGEAHRLVERALKQPADLGQRSALFDVVLDAGDLSLADLVNNTVREEEGPEGTRWRTGQAALLLRQHQSLAQAERLLSEVRQLRPDWSRAVLLQAQLDESKGKAADALAGYWKAFHLGERQLDLVQRLVRLLLAQGEEKKADEVLSRYQQTAALPPDLARLAAELALKLRFDDRAIALARQAVGDNPKTVRDLIWLGRFLDRASQPREAEKWLHKAIQETQELDPEAWTALVEVLGHNDRTVEVGDALARMKKVLPQESRDLALADALQALGRMEEANQHYKNAVLLQPSSSIVLRRAIDFSMRLDKPSLAERLLRQLLALHGAVDEDRPWARRQLALILAFRGGDENQKMSEALLEMNRQDGEKSLSERRARALVKANRPEQRQEALVQLQATVKVSPLTPDEHYRLVRIHESAGDASTAQKRCAACSGAMRRTRPTWSITSACCLPPARRSKPSTASTSWPLWNPTPDRSSNFARNWHAWSSDGRAGPCLDAASRQRQPWASLFGSLSQPCRTGAG